MKAELIRLIALVEDIESTLFHHNHSIDGWHLSGETEPIMNFVADFDMEALTEAKQTLQSLTSVKNEQVEKFIENVIDKELDKCQRLFNNDNFVCVDDVYDAIVNAMKAMHSFANAKKKQEWISVEDRLPELEQIILVYDGYEAQSAKRLFDMCFEDLYTRDILSVTHWMPLPEPPTNI